MAQSTLWWLLTGAAVALELLTGTFYLLMLAIGLAAGALAAHAGMATPMQFVVAAVVGGAAVTVWHVRRDRAVHEPSRANPDINMDIGETVQVHGWNEDGTATVKYRGANWTVVALEGSVHGTGAHRVREVVGSRLVVEKL